MAALLPLFPSITVPTPRPRVNYLRASLMGALMICLLGWPQVAVGQLNLQLDCTFEGEAPADEYTLAFTNTTGSTDLDIKLVTAAFRGFPDQGNPQDCPDISYWERRYPTVTGSQFRETGTLIVPFAVGSNVRTEPLGTYLPDNFPAAATHPAGDCVEYLISVSVRYFVAGSGTPQDVSTSCSSSAFTKPTTPSAPEAARVHADVVAGSVVQPGNDTQEAANCLQAGDTSAGILHNLSPDRTYQGLWTGKFVCKTRNTTSIGDTGPPEVMEVCRSGMPVGALSGRGIRAKIRGFRLDPDDCAGMRVNPSGGFPNCCDCDELSCTSPVVVQCVGAVVMGRTVPGDPSVTYYEPFLFLQPRLDLEPRTEYDPSDGPSPTKPSEVSLAIGCSSYALSDIQGFGPAQVFQPFNDDRFAFDFAFTDPNSVENGACQYRCASGAFGRLEDLDANGVDDRCQHVTVGGFDAGRGRTFDVRRRVRNLFYDGTASTTPIPGGAEGPAGFASFSTYDFAGQGSPLDPDGVVTDLTYFERAALITPGGLSVLGPNQEVVLDPNAPTQEVITPSPFRAADLLFAATDSGTLAAFDLLDERRADLVVAKKTLSPTLASGLRGLAMGPFGGVAYATAGGNYYVYDAACRTSLSQCPDPAMPRSVGDPIHTQLYGASGEEVDDFMYLLAALPSTTPGGGRLAVVQRADHTVFVDGAGAKLFGSIPGTPIDLEVRNLDIIPGGGGGGCGEEGCEEIIPQGGMSGSMSASSVSTARGVAYVTSVELLTGPCVAGGGSPWHRRVLLTAHDLDRPNFTDTAQLGPTIEVSCKDVPSPVLLQDIGLDLAANGRIFVVSPDTNELLVVPASSGLPNGTGMTRLALGWSPTDVFVGDGPPDPLTQVRPEMAIVGGTETASTNGRARVYLDTWDLGSFWEPLSGLGLGTLPSSVAFRDDGTRGYIATPGSSAVRLIDLTAQPTPVLMEGAMDLPGAGLLRRLAIQHRKP